MFKPWALHFGEQEGKKKKIGWGRERERELKGNSMIRVQGPRNVRAAIYNFIWKGRTIWGARL